MKTSLCTSCKQAELQQKKSSSRHVSLSSQLILRMLGHELTNQTDGAKIYSEIDDKKDDILYFCKGLKHGSVSAHGSLRVFLRSPNTSL